MRRSHGRAAVIGVAAPADGRQDIHPWRSQVNIDGAIVGERCQVVALVSRRDTDQVRGSVTTRIRGAAVHIGCIVASCGDEQNPIIAGFGNFLKQGL